MPQITASFGSSVAVFRRNVDTTKQNVAKKIEKAVEKEAKKIMQIMERKTRIRTGRLRRNWRLIPKGSGRQRRYSLINRTPYGVYTSTKDTASTPAKGGTPLADELQKQIRAGEARLRKTIQNILDAEARNFNT